MALNSSDSETIAFRRERVAYHRLRGLSQRAIAAALAEEGVLNSDGQPFSPATVNLDLKALKRDWEVGAARQTSEHRARVLAELHAVRAAAWEGAGNPKIVTDLLEALKDEEPDVRACAAKALGQVGMPDLKSILGSLKQEADLLGLNAATKQEQSGDLKIRIEYAHRDIDPT